MLKSPPKPFKYYRQLVEILTAFLCNITILRQFYKSGKFWVDFEIVGGIIVSYTYFLRRIIEMKCNGELVTPTELADIAEHICLSKHAREQLNIRNFGTNKADIRAVVLNPLLAYYNTDGSINIAVNRWEYFVFMKMDFGYLMITYKEQSHNGIDIFAKREMAIRGYGRQGF